MSEYVIYQVHPFQRHIPMVVMQPLLWQSLVTRPIETQSINFKDGYHCGDYKRTWQGVPAELLSYLYKLQMVCATNN